MPDRRQSVLCISSYEKGQPFLEEAAEQDLDVTLLTVERLKDGAWPRESLLDVVTMPDTATPQEALRAAYSYARHVKVDRVVALDEFDLESAALIREEMRLPGMGQSTTRQFRDKLAMRVAARRAGLNVPPFVRILHYPWIQKWMDETPGPWILKPRTSASAIGVRLIEKPRDLWMALDELGDRQNDFLLEKFIPGGVFHVDSITWDGKVLFQEAHAYGAPPMQIMHQGGVFTTQTLHREGSLARSLRMVDQELVTRLGMVSGVTHSEYIESDDDGEIYFLETAARVGGAYIADLIETATGINLWVEWARIEAAMAYDLDYALPFDVDKRYAGSVLCLARVPEPDLSAYDDPEIARKLNKHHHAGLLVESFSEERVRKLLEGYKERFSQDFLASAPVPDRPTA